MSFLPLPVGAFPSHFLQVGACLFLLFLKGRVPSLLSNREPILSLLSWWLGSSLLHQ